MRASPWEVSAHHEDEWQLVFPGERYFFGAGKHGQKLQLTTFHSPKIRDFSANMQMLFTQLRDPRLRPGRAWEKSCGEYSCVAVCSSCLLCPSEPCTPSPTTGGRKNSHCYCQVEKERVKRDTLALSLAGMSANKREEKKVASFFAV